MPHRAPLRIARELLEDVERCNAASLEATGDINPSAVADLIHAALQDEICYRGVLLVLAEAVATAVESRLVDSQSWEPQVALKKCAGK